jgi:uncharacterized membrane protein YbhN (UPF0104 family)
MQDAAAKSYYTGRPFVLMRRLPEPRIPAMANHGDATSTPGTNPQGATDSPPPPKQRPSPAYLWTKKLLGLAITVAIFWRITRPIVSNWATVEKQILAYPLPQFVLAAVMFATFLFLFRAMTWWVMLRGFGHRLPLAASVRIWSTSELARYIPGSIWQVLGRIYLVRPYGVSGSVCSTSQILELASFLLVNLCVALSCLLWYFSKIDPQAKPILLAAMGLVPFLGLLLHPRIFYRIVNVVMRRIGKQPIVVRLRGKHLSALLVWSAIGLLWQSAAVYVLTADSLHLQPTKWWVVAGSYCLAWCAGFLAFWAPGGLGVREWVFVTVMAVALPDSAKQQFSNPASLAAYLAFLSILLRLWATAGELLVTGLAYLFDIKGALGRQERLQVYRPSAPPLA